MATGDRYSEEYMEIVFYQWYDGGRKLTNTFINSLPKDDKGRVPGKFTITEWSETRGWYERADALDAEVSRALDIAVIDRRKAMYEKQVQIANELVDKGMEFLNEKGITSDASAIRAIDLGLSTQRTSTGMAEAYVKISKMSDEQLTASLTKLIGGKKQDSVDAEIIEDE